jgi:hypothetical protein
MQPTLETRTVTVAVEHDYQVGDDRLFVYLAIIISVFRRQSTSLPVNGTLWQISAHHLLFGIFLIVSGAEREFGS